MGRNRKISKVQAPPRVEGFNPFGYYANEQEAIILHVEEYEAIRLLDYESLNQKEAAEYMSISRPSLTRIYERARKKIATALTQALQIKIEGGASVYNGSWLECENCNSHFNKLPADNSNVCPLCGSSVINQLKVQE